MACDATASPARFAASRRGNSSSSMRGRIAGSRRNAPPGVSIRSSPGSRCRDVRERIDVERADDARIQALEVEHPDVPCRPGHRLEHVAALLRRVHARVVGAHGRRDDLQPLELAQIQKVERRDARGDAIRRHAGQLAARERERHEVELRDDLDTRAAHRCAHRARTPADRAR